MSCVACDARRLGNLSVMDVSFVKIGCGAVCGETNSREGERIYEGKIRN